MSTFQSNENRKQSDIELKTIAKDKENAVRLLESEETTKSDQDHVNHKRSQRINIKFNDVIYRARRNISWDRCKCNNNKLLQTESALKNHKGKIPFEIQSKSVSIS